MCKISGFALMEVQNVHQTSHALWALLLQEGMTSAATVFLASNKSARSASLAEGGTF